MKKNPNEKLTGQGRQNLRDFLLDKGVANNDIAHLLNDVNKNRREVSDDLRGWLKERPKAKKVKDG